MSPTRPGMNHCSHSSSVPDGDAGEQRQHEHRDVAARPPDAIEEQGDEAVLDEVHALDGVDFGDALGVPERVGRCQGQRAAAIAPYRNARRSRIRTRATSERAADREGDGRGHDRRVLARERRADPVADVADERRRQDHRARDDESEYEPEARHPTRCTTAEFGDSHG